jgi:hypothetical protein
MSNHDNQLQVFKRALTPASNRLYSKPNGGCLRLGSEHLGGPYLQTSKPFFLPKTQTEACLSDDKAI